MSVMTYFQVLKHARCYEAMGNVNVLLKWEYQIVKKNREINMVKSCLEEHFQYMATNENNMSSPVDCLSLKVKISQLIQC